MDCNTLRDELKAYLDGELPAARRLAIRMHLTRCADCREEKIAMEQISHELRAGDAGELTADLRSRILEGASPALPNPEFATTGRPWLLKHAMEIWVASAIVVVVGFVLWPVFSQARESARSPMMMKMAGRMSGGGGIGGSNEDAEQVVASAVPQVNEQKDVVGRQPMASMGGESSSSTMTPSRDAAGFFADGHAKAKSASGGQTRSMMKEGWSAPTASTVAALPAIQRHVVKTADITVEVEKLEEKSDAVEKMVRDSGGFVANNQLSTADEGTKSASLSLRVPVDKFDAVLASVAKLGEVKAKNVTGEDITEKVSDDSQSVAVLREEIKAIDGRLTRKIGFDRQQDEETRRQLRERIAQTEGRLESMKKLAALASMTVQLREKSKTAIRGGGFIDEMGDTGRSAVNSFLLAARIPILALIWILAYAPVWAPLAIGYRYASKAHRQRVAVREAREWQSRRSQTAGADATA